jgi:hypothetical protein
MGGDLLVAGSPFLDVLDRKAGSDQQVEVGGHGSVLLDDTVGQPIGLARPFVQIIVDRPALAAIAFYPTLHRGGGHHRVLGRERQPSAGRQRAVHNGQHRFEIFEIVQRQRAVGEVECAHWQIKPLQISAPVGNRRIIGLGAGARQHLLRNIEPEHACRTLLPRPAAEPAETAAKIDHVAASEIG